MSGEERACPSCGATVYPSDSTCMSCGASLANPAISSPTQGRAPSGVGPPAPPGPSGQPRAAAGQRVSGDRPRRDRTTLYPQSGVIDRLGCCWPALGVLLTLAWGFPAYLLVTVKDFDPSTARLDPAPLHIYVWIIAAWLLLETWLLVDVRHIQAPGWWSLAAVLGLPGMLMYLFARGDPAQARMQARIRGTGPPDGRPPGTGGPGSGPR